MIKKAKFLRDENFLIIETDNDTVNNLSNLADSLFFEYNLISETKISFEPKMEFLDVIYKYLSNDKYEIDMTEKMKLALIKNKSINDEPVVIIRKERKSPVRIDQTQITNKNEIKSLKLTDLFRKVKEVVELNFINSEWLEAEISNFKISPKKHIYLDLIETDNFGNELAKNKAIIWGRIADNIISKFKNGTGYDLDAGQKVLLKVEIKFDLKYGLNLNVVDINPEFTLGEMEAKIKNIRKKLIDENIYEKNRILNVPFTYKNLAVISPQDAAGLKDFQVDAEKLKNANLCNFDYYEAIFQGVQTKSSIINAIKKIKENIEVYDAIIIIRGGGAKSDLHYLNEYEIAKEICELKVPVIVGIGHQIDSGILDEVACIKEDTPSKVINYIYNVIYDRYISFSRIYKEFNNIIINNIEKVKNATNIRHTQNKERIKNSVVIYKNSIENKRNTIKNLMSENINVVVNNTQKKKMELFYLNKNIINIIQKDIENKINSSKMILNEKITSIKNDVTYKNNLINKLDPIEIFKKGFSAIFKDGKSIKSVEDINKNDIINIYLKDGKISAKIEEVENVKS